MNAKPIYTVTEIQNGKHYVNKRNTSMASQTNKDLFDHKKTAVVQDNKKGAFATLDERLEREDRELDEQRSMKSEFDYSTKRKFVDMISK
jgi:hypothetical protein